MLCLICSVATVLKYSNSLNQCSKGSEAGGTSGLKPSALWMYLRCGLVKMLLSAVGADGCQRVKIDTTKSRKCCRSVELIIGDPLLRRRSITTLTRGACVKI